MTFKHLLAEAKITPAELVGDAEVAGVTHDSRQAKSGSLFICMPGMTRESEGFIPDAKAMGAGAALVHSGEGMRLAVEQGLAAALIPHTGEMFSDAAWRVCDVFFEHPTRQMKVLGVTGTNGKTTTAWLLRDLLAHLGFRAAYLGTLGFHLPGEEREIDNTTPFAVQLYNLLAEARDKGVQALAMEASSHALAQHRLDGVEFDCGILTNITQDHLDFHGTMESYAEAKHRLFTGLPLQTQKRFVGAFNVDDPIGQRWALEQNGPSLTYGIKSSEVDLRGVPLLVAVDRIRMRLEYRGDVEVEVPLGGSYNVENTLSAVAGLLATGFHLEEIAAVLPKVRPVPGRFEAVRNDRGIGILVDYAHTPDALEKLLDSVRDLNPSRIITVFGCGGDRDRTKRPKMARAASERSELTVVTSDNPRTEDPQAILDEVKTGVDVGRESVAILDRREAVAYAIGQAKPGDVVVIAGKGHENYQILGRTKHHMDDRELAREALR
ncbi:MAG TPA: UDP-N-acetylmuramoyl-L-alanyl-D-glutamate--2,6-diaminopimelate ligase [Fimbriimonas sp.]|nr:UDP-N-acetylmuramoyl-L-alanyl-D-glutamate--2,6-diaminopimelate ligase [Fimbriimonas sp.]